jgi:hypothetical protein
MYASNSTAIGLNEKYFSRDYEGVIVLGSTNISRIALVVYSLVSKSAKF